MRQRVVIVTCDGCHDRGTIDADTYIERGEVAPEVPVGWTYDQHGKHRCPVCTGASVWVPTFECEPVQVISDDVWPVVVIVKGWEENDMGERRSIGVRTYSPTPVKP